MAFQGYLLKFGSGVFPNKYFVQSSYKSTPYQRLEIDSYRDANALLHRETIGNYKTKIDFNTKANLKEQDKVNMFNIFSSGLVNQTERKYYIEYWNDESHSYRQGYFYMPDVEYTIKKIDEKNNTLIYDSLRIAFIEY